MPESPFLSVFPLIFLDKWLLQPYWKSLTFDVNVNWSSSAVKIFTLHPWTPDNILLKIQTILWNLLI